MNPGDLQYTKEHEWIRLEGDNCTVGVTAHAGSQLGEVVYAELPKPGDKFEANEAFGTVESVKAVSELFMPVSGEIIEVNQALADVPESVNDDPYGEGWMVRIRMTDRAELKDLLSAEDYEGYIADSVEDGEA